MLKNTWRFLQDLRLFNELKINISYICFIKMVKVVAKIQTESSTRVEAALKKMAVVMENLIV